MASNLLATAEEDDEDEDEDFTDPGDSVFHDDATSSLISHPIMSSTSEAVPVRQQSTWSRKFTGTMRSFFSINLSSRKLKWTHIILNLLAIILSTLIFFQLGWSVKDFSNQCILYANMQLVRDNSTSNETIIRVQQTTQWGTIQTCQFCIYLNVIISIIQFIWTWFLLMFSIKSVAEDDIEILLYLPNFLTTLVATLMTLVSSGMISAGFSEWCRSIESVGDCASLSSFKWSPDSGSSGYIRLQITEICSWLLFVVLTVTLVIVLYRICKDNRLAAKYYKPNSKRKKTPKKSDAASSPGWSPYRRPTSNSLPSTSSSANLATMEQIRLRKVHSQGDRVGIDEEHHIQRGKSHRQSTVSTRQTRI